MNRRTALKFVAPLLGIAFALGAPQGALAAGTNACTVVTNNATLSYSVGGTPQTNKDTTLSPATFTVGNKVMFVVEKFDLVAVPVIPNTSGATLVANASILQYTVTNVGNALQDFTLAVQATAGAVDPFGGVADGFDLGTLPLAYVETDAVAGYLAAGDTATTILALNPTVILPGEAVAGQKTVYVVPTGASPQVPAAQADGTQAVYVLEATAKKGDGTAGTAEANSASATIYKIGGGTCTAAVQFAETTHTSNKAGEAPNDGVDTARDTFKVCTATIAIAKTASVYWDPINLLVSPKAIPGAIMRYDVAIGNTGCKSATLTSISDVLAASLQIKSTAAGASWSVTGSTRGTTSGTLTADTGDANSDGLGHTNAALVAGTLNASMSTILATDVPNSYTAGELKPNETAHVVFDVTIQ